MTLPPGLDNPETTPDRIRVNYANDVNPTGVRATNPPSPLALVAAATVRSGPLPDPAALAAYKEIDPSLPNRIVTMAEQNAETERLTKRREQSFSFISELTGRAIGAAFATGMIVASWDLAMHNHDAVAAVIAGTTVLGITVALIKGRSP